MKLLFHSILSLFHWFRNIPTYIQIIIFLVLIGMGWFTIPNLLSKKNQNSPQYQTVQVERGTLTVTVSASGQVSSANSASVTTQASGVVKTIFVQNGQSVQTGTPIAELDLDLDGKQRSSQAYANYISAKNALETARNTYYTLQSDMFTKWKTYMDIAQNSTYQNPDGSPNTTTRELAQFYIVKDDWLATEAKYKQQENVVSQAQNSLAAAWSTYQQNSPIIYAPISGTVTGLSLQIGSVLNAQSNSSGTSASQKIASIQTNAPPIIQVNLSQIDTPKVKFGDVATVTFDAFSGKTYTGKVISIDTIGSISSGVTTYPAYIKLDTDVPNLYSNMSAQATIITNIVENALLVPTTAIQTQNGQSSVRLLVNGNVTDAIVETGLSTITQTEIISGLNVGDVVITSTKTPAQSSTQNRSNSQSPFGGFGGAMRFGGR